MKRLIQLGLALIFLFSTGQSAVPKLMNYQGILNGSGGGPVTDSTYSVDFTIYDAPVGGTVLWSESRSVTTVDGLFSIILGTINPVVDSVFNDSTRWMGIQVNPDLEIAPRNQIVSVGYSYRVSSVDGASGGNIISKVSIGTGHSNTGVETFVAGVNNTVSGDASVVGGGGGNTASGIISTVSGGGGNSAEGFAATVGGGQNDSATANYATVSGGGGNVAKEFAVTVSGGQSNNADAAYAVIGGGFGNNAEGGVSVIGGGDRNRTLSDFTTIGGGQLNSADSAYAVVVGGNSNVASGVESFVGGGFLDSALGFRSTVSGGSANVAGGQFSTVPGGRRNKARADYSFAAGRRAVAEHIGTFVWADSADEDFTSTADNQYLIRAERMGLGLNDPSVETKLHIRHFDGDNFGLLIDAHGNSGSEIGLHSGFARYSSLVKNAYHSGGNWQRFNTADGAFLQEISPVGNVDFLVAPAGANPIAFTSAMHLNASNGFVGIGTSSPTYILETQTASNQYSFSHTDGTIGLGTYINSLFSSGMIGTYTNHPFQIYTSNSGPVITFSTGGSTSGNVGIGSTAPTVKLDVHETGATVARFNRNTNDGVIVALAQGGLTEGTISVAGAVVSYNAFTGSHYGLTDENIKLGELVSLTGVNSNLHNNDKSEIIYGIKKSQAANDPSCLGAYLALSEYSAPQSAENPHLIMAVGNGEMWVVDKGRDIQAGDYLISSSTAGHAMLDDEAKYPVGHIVARAAEGVDWSEVVEQVDGLKHKKISVLFGNFDRSNTTVLNQTIASQQKRIEDLERRLEKLEASSLRSELQ